MMIQAILIFHVAAVIAVLAAFFVNAPWLRPWAVVLAAIAICLPYVLLRTSLGHPNPDPIAGRYEMYAVKQDTLNRFLYMMVGERNGNWPPRLFRMSMKPAEGRQARQAYSYGRNYSVVDITIGDADNAEISSDDTEYDLPDPDKEAYYLKLRAERGGGK